MRSRTVHHFIKCGLESCHVGPGPDGNAYVSRPGRPYPADVDVLFRHGFQHFAAGPLRIQHEEVALGWHEAVALRRQPFKNIGTDLGVDLLSLWHKVLAS